MPPVGPFLPFTSTSSSPSGDDANKSFTDALSSLDALESGRGAQGRPEKSQSDKDNLAFQQAQMQGLPTSDAMSPGAGDTNQPVAGAHGSAGATKLLQNPLAPSAEQLSKIGTSGTASPLLPAPTATPISPAQGRTLLATTGIAQGVVAEASTTDPPLRPPNAKTSPEAVKANDVPHRQSAALASPNIAPVGTYDKVLQTALLTVVPAFNWQSFALQIEKSATRFHAEDLLLRVQARQQNLAIQAKMRELGLLSTQGKLEADQMNAIVHLAKTVGFQTRMFQTRYPESLMAQDSSKRPSQIDLEPHLSSERKTEHVKQDIARSSFIQGVAAQHQGANDGPIVRIELPDASGASLKSIEIKRQLLSSGEVEKLSPADRKTYKDTLLPEFFRSHANDLSGRMMAFQHEVNVLNSAADKVTRAMATPGLAPDLRNRLASQKLNLETAREQMQQGELQALHKEFSHMAGYVGRHPNPSGDVGRARAHQESERQAIITELQETTFVAKAGSDKTPDEMRAEAMGHKRNLDLRVIALDGFLAQFAWDSKDNKSARWHSGAPSVANTILDAKNALRTLAQESLHTPENESRRLQRLGNELVLSRIKGLNQSSLLEINEKHYSLLNALDAPHGNAENVKQELKAWAQTSDISRERMLRHYTDRKAAIQTSLDEAKAGADPQRAFHERDSARYAVLLAESKHLSAMESFWKNEVTFRIDHRKDTGLRNLTFGSLRTAVDLRSEQKTMKRANEVAPEMRTGNVLKTPTWADGSAVDFTNAKEAETYYDAAARAGGSIMGDTTRGGAYGAYRNRYFEFTNAITGSDYWVNHFDQKYDNLQYQGTQGAINEGVAQINDLERKGAARINEMQSIAADMAMQIINVAFSPIR